MLVVNLFSGPGAGKSTLAAATFAELKKRGITAELAGEFAKDCAWEGRTFPLTVQPYVFGEQLMRLKRLEHGGVEVAVCDSPLLLSKIYAPEGTPWQFGEAVGACHEDFWNLNVWVTRSAGYDPKGRFQTEEEAKAVDEALWKLCSRLPMLAFKKDEALRLAAGIQRLLKPEEHVECCHKTRLVGAPCPVGQACPYD